MTSPTVTEEDCERSKKGIFRQIGAIFTILGLLFVASAWAINATNGAADLATTVKTAFEVHEARQEEATANLHETLKRIEADGKQTRALVEQIHRNGHAPPTP